MKTDALRAIEAAEIIDDHRGIFACIALGDRALAARFVSVFAPAAVSAAKSMADEDRAFFSYDTPEEEARDLEKPDRSNVLPDEVARERRVIALCLFAAMLEAGDI